MGTLVLFGAVIAGLLMASFAAVFLYRRQRRQDQRRNALVSVGLAASGVSHDLNNILTCIGGYAELLREEVDATTRADLIKQIAELSGCATRLNQQLINLVGRRRQQDQCKDVFAQLLEATQLIRTALGHSIAVSMELPAERIDVALSRSQMDQIILNLVINARDAEAGKVSISGSIGSSMQRGRIKPVLELKISDDGNGMSAMIRQRATRAFFTANKQHGTGLGLATVSRLAKQAGGTVSIESASGKGTSVTVTLPCTRISSPEESGAAVRSGQVTVPEESLSPDPLRRAC